MNSHDSDNKSDPIPPKVAQIVPSEPQSAALENDIILDPKIQEAIGQSLKVYYDDLVNTPMPDRFMVLLAELSAKELKNDK